MDHLDQNPSGKQKKVIDIEKVFHGHETPVKEDPGLIIHYKIKIDDNYFESDSRIKMGKELLHFTGKSSSDFELLQNKKSGFHSVQPDEIVDLGSFGIELFITKPHKKKYHFFIEKKEYTTEHQKLTVKQILVDYAKVDPANKTLAIKIQGGFYEYKDLNEVIDLKDCPHFTLFDNDPTTVS